MAQTARRRGFKGTLFVLLIIATLAGVAVWLGTHKPADHAKHGPFGGGPGARPVPVVAAEAVHAPMPVWIDALGTVTPRSTVTVRARVDGQLMRVAFQEGQQVKAGDLLAEIDPRPFEVALLQAKGQLGRDEALLTNAETDLKRYRQLLAEDSISKQQTDTQASLVNQYRAAIDADKAAVENAKLQLSYTRITAPVGGHVGLRQVDPGNMIHASDTGGIVTITELTPITVVFSIPETSLPRVLRRVRAGEKLEVQALDRDRKDLLANGALLTVDNQIDPTTGTIKLKAQFDNRDGALYPNQFVNVRMRVAMLNDAVVIPASAVLQGRDGPFAYVVKQDGTVTVRPLKLGPGEGDRRALESGVAAGEKVVADGTDKLRDGAKVELIGKDAPPPAAGAEGANPGAASGAHPGAASGAHPGAASGAQPGAPGERKGGQHRKQREN